MKRRTFFQIAGAVSLSRAITSAHSQAQDPAAAAAPELTIPKAAKQQFFAGAVVQIDGRHVQVSRDLPGQPPETRDFMIDGKTRLPKGGVKPKSRVTIRYQHVTDHDLALEVQVRPTRHASKSS